MEKMKRIFAAFLMTSAALYDPRTLFYPFIFTEDRQTQTFDGANYNVHLNMFRQPSTSTA